MIPLDDLCEFVSLNEAINSVNFNEPLYFDVETDELYGKICLAQFYQESWTKVLLVKNPSSLHLFSHLSNFDNNKVEIVTQFGSYEVSTIQAQTGARWVPEHWQDTFYLSRLAFPHLNEYSLDALISYVHDLDVYKEAGIDKSELQKSDWSKPVLSPEQIRYAAYDVYYLPLLYNKVKASKEDILYKLDMSCNKIALDFQTVGMPLDPERIESQWAKNLTRIEEIALPVNANSYQQVRPYIGSDNSNGLGLATLTLEGNEKAAAVNETRKLLKQNSFLKTYSNAGDRVYGRFAPSARSGRFTCNKENLEQIPRKLKQCFGYTPEVGRVLIYSDYPGLELRSIAAIVGETRLLELFREGGDVHNFVAEFIFGANFTKRQRQITKTINFNALYGGSAYMMRSILIQQAGLLLSETEISRYLRKWKRLFPKISAWQQEKIRAFHRGQLGSTPLGRRYKAARITDQMNIENQGFGAEIAKLAMHYMYKDLKDVNVEMCNFIHDSYICDSENDKSIYEPACEIIAHSMKKAWSEGCKKVLVKNIPMPIKVSVGFNWGDIEDEECDNLYDLILD